MIYTALIKRLAACFLFYFGTMPKKKKRYHSYAALFGQRRFCKQREGIVCERLVYLIFIITDKARARRGVRYKVSVL